MSNNFNDNSDLKITKPLNKLQRSVNKNVMVRLKNDVEYRGKMTNVDAYMNVILNDAEEYADGTLSANYGKVVIRGNNVLFINIKPDILMCHLLNSICNSLYSIINPFQYMDC